MLHDVASDQAARPAALNLVEEISHRVVNELTEAIAMLSLAARTHSGAVQTTLERTADRLRCHAQSHRALLPPRTSDRCDLADHLARVCGAMANGFIADNGAQLLLRADNALLAADQCWRIGLIVAELVRNAARHGLSGGPGLIIVRIMTQVDIVTCTVCDNGHGKPSGAGGLGQGLVRRLADELGGGIEWRFNDHGTTAQATFPLSDPDTLPLARSVN